MRKFFRNLVEIGFPILICLMLLYEAITTSDLEQTIYVIGFVCYGEIFCVFLEMRINEDKKIEREKPKV